MALCSAAVSRPAVRHSARDALHGRHEPAVIGERCAGPHGVEERDAVVALRVGDAGIDAPEHDRRLLPPNVHVVRLRLPRLRIGDEERRQRLPVVREVQRLVRHRRHRRARSRPSA